MTAPSDKDYSLYGEEESLIDEAGNMVVNLEEVASWVTDLASHYKTSYKESTRMVRLSDGMQLKLQDANRKLKKQAEELTKLRALLDDEIQQRKALELQLADATQSKKAKPGKKGRKWL